MLRKRLLELGLVDAAEPGVSSENPAASPEATLSALEDAYRNRDIESAIALKDFLTEAKFMLTELGGDTLADAEILKSMAETLEPSFRADIEENGFPDFIRLECSAVSKHLREPEIVAL